jgi:hypothetical protein
MNEIHQRLYDLVPAIIRLRDADQGEPLRGLLEIIAEQAARTEDDVRQFFDNFFIETAEQQYIPYIGDLVGYRPIAQAPTAAGWGVPRRDVADTLRLRRRKGSLAVLSELAAVAADWPTSVAEDPTDPLIRLRLWRLRAYPLTRTRPFYQPRRINCYTFSVLGNDAPLFTTAQEAGAGQAPPHPPLPLTRDLLETYLRTFYGDGRSLCLYENGRPVAAARILVRDLTDWGPEVVDDQVAVDPELGRFMYPEVSPRRVITSSSYYGFIADLGGGEYSRPPDDHVVERSLFRPGHLLARGTAFLASIWSNDPFSVYLRERIAPDVLAWAMTASLDPAVLEQTLDDELNRLLQACALADGPIDLTLLDDEARDLYATRPSGPRRIRLNRLILEAAYPDAVARSYALVRVTAAPDRQVIAGAIRDHLAAPRPAMHLVVELADSGLYVEPVVVAVEANHTLELRAADGARPTLLLPERSADVDDMVIGCADGSRLILDGLQVLRRPVRVIGQPAEVVVRDCTLVPGWELGVDCSPSAGEEPSLILSDFAIELFEEETIEPVAPLSPSPCVRIERSILGSIQVQRDEVTRDPLRVWIAGSIVDATDHDRGAISAPNDRVAHAILHVTRSTISGATLTQAIDLGEDTIFHGIVRVARRQIGCLRFCAVEPDSVTPRRYACQPDLAAAERGDPLLLDTLRPRFMNERYGQPNYFRLADDCPPEIGEGASDESEMGVYHDLYQPQRRANLLARLDEFVPLGWIVDLAFES